VPASGVSTNLSTAKYATASTSTPVIRRSTLPPVFEVIERLRSTFFSSLIPSGVISKIQAKNNASGNPRIRKKARTELTQSPSFSAGAIVSPTCMMSQAIKA
jgi:hypothetical protein